MGKLELIPLVKLPIVWKGCDIGDLLIKSMENNKFNLRKNDLIVIAHKIVSISEGRIIKLSDVKISSKAKKISKKTNKSAEIIQLIINESDKILKVEKDFILTKDKNGIVAANAGVDQSNLKDRNQALLLPKNPDKSAKEISMKLSKKFKKLIPVIISDSVGRPWRNGLTQIAIGSYGLKALVKYSKDFHGNELFDTDVPVSDELSSAAGLLMIKDKGIPVVIIRGYNYISNKRGAKGLIRPDNENVFI